MTARGGRVEHHVEQDRERARASRSAAGIAQAEAYSRAFFVIGLICLARALLALFLRSEKAAPGSGHVMAQ